MVMPILINDYVRGVIRYPHTRREYPNIIPNKKVFLFYRSKSKVKIENYQWGHVPPLVPSYIRRCIAAKTISGTPSSLVHIVNSFLFFIDKILY